MLEREFYKWVGLMYFFKVYALCLPLLLPPVIHKVEQHLQNTYYMDGVVTLINTPTYGNNTTKKYLDEFNNMSGGGAVTYGTEGGGMFGRKIEISEAPMTKPEDIGETWPGFNTCTLHVSKNLDYKTYRTVLYHEYLHCFGYEHVDSPDDLMYYANNDTPEENIKHYSEDLAKRIKEWKNSKNSNSNTTPQVSPSPTSRH